MNSFGTDEIQRIVSSYSKTLYRIAYTALRSESDAEDIVQEVFLRLLKKNPVFESEQHEKAWLIRVTVNLSKNRLRRSWRRELPVQEIPESAQPDDSTDDICLLGAVLALPEKYSTVIHLYYYEDYSIADIARLLALPKATVGTRLARGRVLLRRILEGEC